MAASPLSLYTSLCALRDAPATAWATASVLFSSRSRHPRLQGDWSSDVCSSDLIGRAHGIRDYKVTGVQTCALPIQIGRASCRERGQISEVAVSLKKKKNQD